MARMHMASGGCRPDKACAANIVRTTLATDRAKFGIMPANGVGTIDADYRGEVGVILLNTSNESFTVEPGMRIAQMVIAKYEHATWREVDSLDETARGAGGYGSTGHK